MLYLELDGEVIMGFGHSEDLQYTFPIDKEPSDIFDSIEKVYKYKVVSETLVLLTQSERDNHPLKLDNQNRDKVERAFNAVERVVACDYVKNHAQWSSLSTRIKEIVNEERTSKLQELADALGL